MNSSSLHKVNARFCAPLLLGVLLSSGVVRAEEEEVVLTEEGADAPKAKPPEAPKAEAAPADAPTVDDGAGVMVRPFEGPKSQTIHDRVISALEAEGVILIPEGFEDGIKLADAPGPYVEVARKNQIKAYLHGQTKMTRKAWSVTLKLRNGADGKTIATKTLSNYSLPGLLKKIDKELATSLADALDHASVPGGHPKKQGPLTSDDNDKAAADTEKAADASTEVTLEAEPSSSPASITDSAPTPPPQTPRATTSRGPTLIAGVGFGLLQRNLQYSSGVADAYETKLQSHSLTAPALTLYGQWYPGAYKFDGPLANIGLALGLYRSVGGATTVRDGSQSAVKLTSTFTEFTLGLRGRIPVRKFELGLNAAWGMQSMVLDGDNEASMANPDGDPGIVPDIKYTFFQFGPDLHFEFGSPIEVGLLFRTISIANSNGYLAEQRWFPNAAAIGLNAFASFDINVAKNIDLRLGGEARYYGIKPNSGSYQDNIDPGGNAYVAGKDGLKSAVAGGISDTYLGAFVSAHYSIPGTSL
jgi:hypothetical protein